MAVNVSSLDAFSFTIHSMKHDFLLIIRSFAISPHNIITNISNPFNKFTSHSALRNKISRSVYEELGLLTFSQSKRQKVTEENFDEISHFI